MFNVFKAKEDVSTPSTVWLFSPCVILHYERDSLLTAHCKVQLSG